MRSKRLGFSLSHHGTNNGCLPLATTFVLLHLAATAHAFCYFPNGQLTSNYQPCAGDIGTSATTCCDQGYACLGNGLCQATGFELPVPGAREFMRGGCTDKTWTNSGCPLFCIDPKLNNLTSAAGVGSCPGSGGREYYCVDDQHNQLSCGGSGTFELPGNAFAVTIIGVDGTTYASTKLAISSDTSKQNKPTTSATNIPIPQSTAAITHGTGTAPGAQTTSTAAPLQPTSPNTPVTVDNTNATNNTAMIAGVTAGVVGGLILGGVLVWFFLRRRKQHKGQSLQAPTAANFPITINNNINNSRDSKYSTEKQWWWWYQQQQQQQQQQQYNASQQHLPHTSLWQQHSQHSEVHAPSAYSGQNSLSSSGSTTILHELRGGEVRSPQELPANQGSWL